MQDLIKIEATPTEIHANFDEVEQQLQEYLRQYDVVVTQDTVADAKKLATELNKQIGELDRRIKDALAEASAPIKEADERRKQLVQLGKDARAKIQEQVKRYEDETRTKASHQLHDLREELWQQHRVEPEFRSAKFDDLVKLTAVTKKGNLSKAVTDELTNRVRDDKALQDRTEKRLAELAGRSYDAGLAAPLTRDHVAHFLFADDDKYAAELQRILDAEVERQQKAEQRMREQHERERRQQQEAERQEAERQQRLAEAQQAEQAAPQEPEKESTVEQYTVETPAGNTAHVTHVTHPQRDDTPQPQQGDKVAWVVVATFEVNVSPNVTRDAIKAEARRVIEGAGITTLKNVSAQRRQANAA